MNSEKQRTSNCFIWVSEADKETAIPTKKLTNANITLYHVYKILSTALPRCTSGAGYYHFNRGRKYKRAKKHF
jgi:hypothetical protein